MIKEVIEKGSQDPEEVTFRVLLFNSFTKIETWELLDSHCGPLRWKTFDHAKYMKVLEEAHESGQTLYTSAFIKPAPSFGYKHNFANHLCLLQSMMENKLAYRLLGAQYMANVYEYIISFPSMGPFSTYQLMLCLSYTNLLNFHQDDFVISGPGSQSGLNKLFGKSMNDGRTTVVDFEAEVMRYMANTQDEHFKRLGLQFSGLGPNNLPMSIADIEHTLCEVDKYCRVAHPQLKGKRTHITRNFKVPEPLKVGEGKPNPAILPKAWSHPNRRISRIRPEKTLLVEKRYEVKRIDGHRDTENGKQYFVYWVGYPDSDATWEFESSLLEDAPAIVQEYLASLKKPSKKRR
ncbi:hypothetical protein CPC08DRAFT_673900 [Agrocybe pediades]|nr:hypothetical protein CPC08DRAFT_673900 [Agrocybe pediades]